MGTRLISEQIRHDVPLQQLRQHVCAISNQANRYGPPGVQSCLHDRQRLIEAVDEMVAVASRETFLNSPRIDINSKKTGAVHCRGERLRPAHTAKTSADN